MRTRSKILWATIIPGLVICSAAAVFALRTHRLIKLAGDFRSQVRYLADSGQTMGEVPATQLFAAQYLQAVFGEDPELLEKLEDVISRGVAETPGISLGEIAAMIVTYQKDKQGHVHDVIVHLLGGFKLGYRKPGMHRGGYFYQLIDPELWHVSNALVGLAGRDMILLGAEEDLARHRRILDSLLNGNVLPLADSLEDPLYFVVILPKPYRLVPVELRPHVKAILLRGHLAPYDGATDMILLTRSTRSARYALSIIRDLKVAAQVALRTKWKGVRRQTPWGPVVDPWWSFELAQSLDDVVFEKEGKIVRVKSAFGRVIVNVVLKMLERAGRDLAQMRGSMDEKTDPRIVDSRLATRKPLHYWSEEHRWGPNWPIPAKETNAAPPAVATPPVAEVKPAPAEKQ